MTTGCNGGLQKYKETSRTSLTVLLLRMNKTRHEENQDATGGKKDSKVTCQPNERAA